MIERAGIYSPTHTALPNEQSAGKDSAGEQFMHQLGLPELQSFEDHQTYVRVLTRGFYWLQTYLLDQLKQYLPVVSEKIRILTSLEVVPDENDVQALEQFYHWTGTIGELIGAMNLSIELSESPSKSSQYQQEIAMIMEGYQDEGAGLFKALRRHGHRQVLLEQFTQLDAALSKLRQRDQFLQATQQPLAIEATNTEVLKNYLKIMAHDLRGSQGISRLRFGVEWILDVQADAGQEPVEIVERGLGTLLSVCHEYDFNQELVAENVSIDELCQRVEQYVLDSKTLYPYQLEVFIAEKLAHRTESIKLPWQLVKDWLLNTLGNAQKALAGTPEGAVIVRLELHSSRFMALTVTDNGDGFPSQFKRTTGKVETVGSLSLQLLNLEPNVTIWKAGQSGTGVGLSTLRKLLSSFHIQLQIANHTIDAGTVQGASNLLLIPIT